MKTQKNTGKQGKTQKNTGKRGESRKNVEKQGKQGITQGKQGNAQKQKETSKYIGNILWSLTCDTELGDFLQSVNVMFFYAMLYLAGPSALVIFAGCLKFQGQ